MRSRPVHTHSSRFRGPGGAPLLVEPTNPLPYLITETGFSSSSVACENPAHPGIDDPARVRHVVGGTVTDTRKGATRGRLTGTITTFLCRGAEEADQIRISFRGKFKQTSDHVVRFRATFRITGGDWHLRGTHRARIDEGRVHLPAGDPAA